MTQVLTGRRFGAFCVLSLAAWLAVSAACLCFGPGGSFVLAGWVIKFRLVRVLVASLVGAALASSGVTFQALLRNPLASPYVLGVSSGATLGMVLGWYFQHQFAGSAAAAVPPYAIALVAAMLTILLVWALAQRRGRLDPLSLLLVGVMVTAFNGAAIMVLNLLVPHQIRADFVVWMMGMVSEAVGWGRLAWAAGAIGAGWLVLLAMARQFNLQALGEQTARSLGVRVSANRLVAFLVASAVAAVAVAISGPIGFVGLIAPHICRLLFGPDHRVLMVTAAAFGAAFLASADTLVRTVSIWTGGEMPVGVVTALCGGPFFIYLLRRHLR